MITTTLCFINCDDNDNAMFPNTRAFAFSRQPMKRSFTWSTRAINLCRSLTFLCRLKFCFDKKIEDEPAYYPDRYELLQISRPSKNSHCFQKVVQLFNTIRYYFPIRDSKRLECAKKCILKKRNSTAFELTDVYYINLISIIRAVDKGGRAGGHQPPSPTISWSKIFFFHVKSENIEFS